jgi:hypothetical protein
VRIERVPHPEPELPFSLDHFDRHGNLIATLGRYRDLATGREAFATAVRHRPQRHLCLRNRAQVLARHEPDAKR